MGVDTVGRGHQSVFNAGCTIVNVIFLEGEFRVKFLCVLYITYSCRVT